MNPFSAKNTMGLWLAIIGGQVPWVLAVCLACITVMLAVMFPLVILRKGCNDNAVHLIHAFGRAFRK